MNDLDKNTFPEDVWQGTESHPQCCFFELFPSSQDPYETFYGEMFCHMNNTGESAKICKGDYCKCPLSNHKVIDQRIKNMIKEIEEQKEDVFSDDQNKMQRDEIYENIGERNAYKLCVATIYSHIPELKEETWIK